MDNEVQRIDCNILRADDCEMCPNHPAKHFGIPILDTVEGTIEHYQLCEDCYQVVLARTQRLEVASVDCYA